MHRIYPLAVAILLLPSTAFALSISQVAGLFNIFVGLMLTAAFLSYGGGFIVYLASIGTIRRSKGIDLMAQGTVILFVLVVLLAIVQYFQRHPAIGAMIVSAIIVVLIIWAILSVAGESEEKEH